MEHYTPPYTITDGMLKKVSDISEKVGKVIGRRELEGKPHLRRNNRIHSIHSSLRIEANSLSLSEVRDVIDGRSVVGDRLEIAEVKGAYAAYNEIGRANPYSVNDLLRLHAIMVGDTVAQAGVFRTGPEGVFSGDKCIFIAPPPEMVPELVGDLFAWMNANTSKIHPLILSAVFHYEFVFIHPFSDGNGRMARLWHTMLLHAWRPVFEYIPIESQIERFQDAYYTVIARCHSEGNSNLFIEFMLEQIDLTLDTLIEQTKNAEVDEYVRKMLNVMELDVPYTATAIMAAIGLKSKETFRKHYLNPAMDLGLVIMTLPEKPTSRNQQYVRKA